MDSLEGGLEYLKEVVIGDSLAICEELEEQMDHVVDTFQCEWKTTVNDEKALKTFRQFVNHDGQDENVVFVEERNQIRPASDEEKVTLIAKAG